MNHEEVIYELKSVKRVLTIAHSDQIDAYLNAIIKTENRRKMWVAIDGLRHQNDIAKEVGVSPMAVSKLMTILKNVDLIISEQSKPPKKLVNHVPSSWFANSSEE